ncbi:MAG: sulfatase-like hydrolase/transferase [Rikenellaceae bacterium]
MRYFKVTALTSATILSANIAAAEKPNVLIIHTDEHSFRTLGCYREILSEREQHIWANSREVETPNIDALAHGGVMFSRCYATTPVSSPSRASFITGMYPQNCGVETNDLKLRTDLTSFAEQLSDNGYQTYYVGKWHLDGDPKPEWEPKDNCGFINNKYMFNRGHYKLILDDEQGVRESDKSIKTIGLNDKNFTTDFLTNKAIEYIKENGTKTPFCLMLSIPDPHGPNIVRAPYDTMYNDVKFGYPVSAKVDTTTPGWNHGDLKMENMVKYFGMVKCIDDNIGRLVSFMKEENLLHNTIIIFTSDHGDMCGEHHLTNKGVPQDGSSRVPFIVSYPGKIAEGSVVKEAVSVVDFAPTILALTSTENKTTYEGRNISQMITSGKAPKDWKDVVFMRGVTAKAYDDNGGTPSKNQWVSAVSQRFKLVLSEIAGEKPWLLDMQNDPFEMKNEIDNPQFKDDLRFLARELTEYGRKYNDPRILSSSKIRNELTTLSNIK